MEFLGDTSFSVAEYYLGFFVVSFAILGLIVLSVFPAVLKKVGHAFRLIRARRRRQPRMLADQELLDLAGEDLIGLTFFDSVDEVSQEGDDARAGISDAA